MQPIPPFGWYSLVQEIKYAVERKLIVEGATRGEDKLQIGKHAGDVSEGENLQKTALHNMFLAHNDM